MIELKYVIKNSSMNRQILTLTVIIGMAFNATALEFNWRALFDFQTAHRKQSNL